MGHKTVWFEFLLSVMCALLGLAQGYHPLVLTVLLVPQGLVPVVLLWSPVLAPLRVHSQVSFLVLVFLCRLRCQFIIDGVWLVEVIILNYYNF